MTIHLAQIGNSKGIRIPQAILQEVKFTNQAEISIKNSKIIITPTPEKRKNWTQEFKNNSPTPTLLPENLAHSWDEENWEW